MNSNNNEKNNIDVWASIVEVNSKNLVSGDKEVRIKLSVVGPEILEANRLGALKPGTQVRIQYKEEDQQQT